MELHSLDRKLDAFIPTIKYSPDKRQFIIDTFDNILISPTARHVLNILISDLGCCPNQDHINQLSVDDLLTELAERIIMSPSDIDYDHLSVQLEEMTTGMCPQGRTIRLYSVLFAIYSCKTKEVELTTPVSHASYD